MNKKSVSRRTFLKTSVGLMTAGAATSAYAGYVEPALRLGTTKYKLHPNSWIAGLKLKIAVLADIHAGEGYMDETRLLKVVQKTNELNADLIVMLGDYVGGSYKSKRFMDYSEVADCLAGLKAPLGVFAILGNHDWWNDEAAVKRRHGPTCMGIELERVGIPVLENQSLPLTKDGYRFWLAGLGDQWSFFNRWDGIDDLDKTLKNIPLEEPVILLVHEPDIFTKVPSHVSVTLAGHTHGGQINIGGFRPVVPSRFGNRYAYGHIIEDQRHMIVSAGIGSSGISLNTVARMLGANVPWIGNKKFCPRIGVPPEIVLLNLEQ